MINPVTIGTATLHLGDCLDVLALMPDNSVDSIVTDPPYELGFMGKAWDASGIANNVELWKQALRVLKPGGHLLAFSASRTYHRMTCAIEDAGFEVRDQIMWLYGSGFPKSMDISKALDKAVGAERVETGRKHVGNGNTKGEGFNHKGDKSGLPITEPATDDAKNWEGWGTALKPAHEPICVARKPFTGTVVANVQEHGTGAINIDACRVGWPGDVAPKIGTAEWGGKQKKMTVVPGQEGLTVDRTEPNNLGRWPANVIHDGSDVVVNAFPEAGGQQGDLVNHGECRQSPNGIFGGMRPALDHPKRIEDNLSASRFFYCAKTSKEDRNEGLNSFASKPMAFGNQAQAELKRGNLEHENGNSGMNKVTMRKNNHPTVKPTELMQYLCRLVTPVNGVVLDPFMGSGSTGKAAWLEGFKFIGIEKEPEYFEIAKARVKSVPAQEKMFA